jgi:hypothetical protein
MAGAQPTLLILGWLLWAATALAYQRRIRNACGHCGRSDTPTGWTTSASSARWGRWATLVAVTVPILYALTRWAWALGIPLEVTREFLREQARDTPDIWLAGAALATLAVGGRRRRAHPGACAALGEVVPGWIPVLGGKVVRPRTAIIPASLVAVLVTVAGLEHYRAAILGYFPRGQHGRELGDRRPRISVATVGRRSRCRYLRLLPSQARPVPTLWPILIVRGLASRASA